MKYIYLLLLIFTMSCEKQEERQCIECTETTGTNNIEYFCGYHSECEDYKQSLIRNGIYITGYRYKCVYK